jgi:hypothetical protein
VALFSLGNLCGYKECKSLILGNEGMIQYVKKISKQLETSQDKTYIKYAKRFIQRIN